MKIVNLFNRCVIRGVATSVVVLGLSSVANAGDEEKGKELAVTCAACHGADGNSTMPMNPKLAGQYESYLRRALSDYKSGARTNATMGPMAAGLSEQDIRDLAAYFSSQESTLTVPGS